MKKDAYQILLDVLDNEAILLSVHNETYDALLDKIGDARFVMIGEATHGTQEFYQTRIDITQQLILKKGFMGIAIEGDWPDVYNIHRYVQGQGSSNHWEAALESFTRFPQWMWRNTTIPPFIQWLRHFNDQLPTPSEKIGFYGLDLYSLNTSMQAVIDYLRKRDPESAERAKTRNACFEQHHINQQMYGYLTAAGIKKSCINEAIAELIELQHRSFEFLLQDGIAAEDELLFATQNARLIKNAEVYYRSMFESNELSWNIRDTHMAETVHVLANHIEQRFNKPAKIIIWAHNSHVGDARATEMSERGEVNIGQLIREHYLDTYSIGFSTNTGFVTAADNWDYPAECKKVVPGLASSYEALFHQVKHKQFLLNFTGNKTLEHYLSASRLQRAIGVIYRPDSERVSHYFFTHLPQQFDSIIHIDQTTAVEPL